MERLFSPHQTPLQSFAQNSQTLRDTGTQESGSQMNPRVLWGPANAPEHREKKLLAEENFVRAPRTSAEVRSLALKVQSSALLERKFILELAQFSVEGKGSFRLGVKNEKAQESGDTHPQSAPF